jgi:hypothetical protein
LINLLPLVAAVAELRQQLINAQELMAEVVVELVATLIVMEAVPERQAKETMAVQTHILELIMVAVAVAVQAQ